MVKFGQVTERDPKTGMVTITYIRPEACARCGGCGALTQTGSIRLRRTARLAAG